MFFPASLVSVVGLVIAGATACSPERAPPHDPAKRYVCASGQLLDIIHTKQLAIVKLGERIFNLEAKKGSIGERYTDGDATLIIDDGSAVFVSGNDGEALNCTLGDAR